MGVFGKHWETPRASLGASGMSWTAPRSLTVSGSLWTSLGALGRSWTALEALDSLARPLDILGHSWKVLERQWNPLAFAWKRLASLGRPMEGLGPFEVLGRSRWPTMCRRCSPRGVLQLAWCHASATYETV